MNLTNLDEKNSRSLQIVALHALLEPEVKALLNAAAVASELVAARSRMYLSRYLHANNAKHSFCNVC